MGTPVLAVNELGTRYSDQTYVKSWLVQPIKEMCLRQGCVPEGDVH